MRKTYPTDLSDTEWDRLKTHLPDAMLPGRLRAHSLRDIFDAIFYVLRSGCPWRMLPGDFPPWSTVYYHFKGGHFAAWEQPQLFSEEVRAGFRSLR